MTNIPESVRRSLTTQKWWGLCQEEVQEKLQPIINNIAFTGTIFRDAFISLFRFENVRRYLAGKSKDISEPSPFFGHGFPEECYQAGKNPVKILLDLNDWVEPNDSDVFACVMLCHQIDTLEKLGLITSISEEDSSPSPPDENENI